MFDLEFFVKVRRFFNIFNIKPLHYMNQHQGYLNIKNNYNDEEDLRANKPSKNDILLTEYLDGYVSYFEINTNSKYLKNMYKNRKDLFQSSKLI